ncbi:MAG: cysteine hydrolase [Sphingomonas sp.]|uniref:cysteine hydrolase family protein n=1 Tax=Sphingomonas sp. TaxID=28214 RepID=UPI0017EDC74E|nr:cysteine hydrolase family protein [Sphingomonas sp.]MBA3667028.1 cysteine hydrolase [Sphingomonas sp.]
MTMDLDLDHTVLLPIDMQRAFDGPQWPRRWNDSVDANGIALIEEWRSAGRTIIHVRHDSLTPGSNLFPGSPGNGFRPGFGPVGDEALVTKSVNSAFIGTDLDLRLKRLGARHVIVFGIATDICVSTTIRTGANMGWDMILVPDACDCFDLPDGQGGVIPAEQIQAAHVATLAFEFCRTIPAAQLLALKEAA